MAMEGGATEEIRETGDMDVVSKEEVQEEVVITDQRIRMQATVATQEGAVGLHYRQIPAIILR